MACKDWDSGWCYAEGTKYISGCVGEAACEYKVGQLARIDIIASNGNDGKVYLVEKMAKRLAGKDFDMMLSGKKGVRRRWEDFVPLAIELLDIVEEFQNG